MSKTDGIGTWVWNVFPNFSDTLHYEYEGSAQIDYAFDFVSNGTSYAGVNFGISKTGDIAYSGSWLNGDENSPYRTIDIKTAPPAEFLTILQANATYQEPKLTDLTGTTWKWNENLVFDSRLNDNPFKFDVNFSSFGREFIELDIGGIPIAEVEYTGTYIYYYNWHDSTIDVLVYMSESDTDLGDFVGWNGGTNSPYRLISITGGTDATNTDLINYLYANAELQGSAPVIDKYKLIDQNGNLIEVNSMKKGIVVYQGKEYEFDNN